MSLNFKQFQEKTASYIIYCMFGVVAILYADSNYKDFMEKSDLKKQIIKLEKKMDEKDRKIESLIAEKDTLFKLNGYLNRINQNNFQKK